MLCPGIFRSGNGRFFACPGTRGHPDLPSIPEAVPKSCDTPVPLPTCLLPAARPYSRNPAPTGPCRKDGSSTAGSCPVRWHPLPETPKNGDLAYGPRELPDHGLPEPSPAAGPAVRGTGPTLRSMNGSRTRKSNHHDHHQGGRPGRKMAAQLPVQRPAHVDENGRPGQYPEEGRHDTPGQKNQENRGCMKQRHPEEVANREIRDTHDSDACHATVPRRLGYGGGDFPTQAGVQGFGNDVSRAKLKGT